MEEPASDNPFSVPEWVDAEIHRILGLPLELQDSAFDELAVRAPEHAGRIRARRKLADEDPDVSAPLRLGRYQLVARLGAGGMGTVHLGFDPQLERHVAIKVMAAHLLDRPVLRKRFALEATAVAAIRHPNVCRVLEAQPDGDQPYIVMDFIEGKSLDKRLEDTSLGLAPLLPGMTVPMPGSSRPSTPTSHAEIGSVLGFIEKTARALHELHQRGVVHRDVKPSNLMVTPAGEPVVLDFGLVLTEQGAGITRSNDRPGTRIYQAPEQLGSDGTTPDARADVFSLGLVLYECLTLQRAFGEDRSAKSLPEPALRLNRAIPRDARTVIEKAIELEPGQRYASALELAEDLRLVCEGHAPRAQPIGLAGRIARWSRRNPWAAAFFIVLSVGLCASSALTVEVNAAASEKQIQAANASFVQGEALTAQGNWDGALRALERARSFGHDAIAVDLARLDIYVRAGRDAEAKDILGRLVVHPPGPHSARIALLRGLLARDRWRDPSAGLSDLAEALAAGTLNEADTSFALAMRAEALGDVQRHLEEALRADPFHFHALMVLGPVLLFAGDTAGFVEHARSAAQRFPQNPQALAELAVSLLISRDDEATEAVLTRFGTIAASETADWAEAAVKAARVLREYMVPRLNHAESDLSLGDIAKVAFLLAQFQSLPTLGADGASPFAGIHATIVQAGRSVVAVLLRVIAQDRSAKHIETLTAAIERVPDGFFFLLRGLFHAEHRHFAEAEADMLEACSRPSIVGFVSGEGVRRWGESFLLRTYFQHNSVITDDGERNDLRQRVYESLQRITRLQPRTAEECEYVWTKTRDLRYVDCALETALGWQREHPSSTASVAVAESYLALKALPSAEGWAKRVLNADPKPPAAIRRRAEAVLEACPPAATGK